LYDMTVSVLLVLKCLQGIAVDFQLIFQSLFYSDDFGTIGLMHESAILPDVVIKTRQKYCKQYCKQTRKH